MRVKKNVLQFAVNAIIYRAVQIVMSLNPSNLADVVLLSIETTEMIPSSLFGYLLELIVHQSFIGKPFSVYRVPL